MGHLPELVIIAFIILALFGPKTLQSLGRDAGRGISKAKDMKAKVMETLPVEEINKMVDKIPQVPLNPRQAAQMLLTSNTKETEKKSTGNAPVEVKTASPATQPVVGPETETTSSE